MELPKGFANESLVDWSKTENQDKMRTALLQVKNSFPILVEKGGDFAISLNPADKRQIVGCAPVFSFEYLDFLLRENYSAWQSWRYVPVSLRAEKLLIAANIMQKQRFELAALLVYEVGKTWVEADAEIAEAIDYLRLYALSAQEFYSQPRSTQHILGEKNEIHFEPIGVVAVLGVWNFPLAINVGMTSAALVCGNSVVFKPAWQSPIIGTKIAEIYWQAGVPEEVFSIVFGSPDNEEVGQFIVRHPLTARIAFTGSKDAGLAIIKDCALYPCEYEIKKLDPGEFGGKGKIIVDRDADLDEAIKEIVHSAFSYAGQKCSACTICIVIDDSQQALFYKRFCSRLAEAVDSIIIGPPEDSKTFMGPLISQEQLERVKDYINIGKSEGRLMYEGNIPEALKEQGYYHPPVIFTDVSTKAKIYQEEIFGPVLIVVRASNLSQAIEMFNQSQYALTGGMFSSSETNLEIARRKCNVGNWYENRGIVGAVVGRQPFGGWKGSGIGSKAGTPVYLERFLHLKTVSKNIVRRGALFDN